MTPVIGRPQRLGFSVGLRYTIDAPGADFIFNIQPARTPQQRVISEQLLVNPSVAVSTFTDAVSRARYVRLTAGPGLLTVRCDAVVELTHHRAVPQDVAEVPVRLLPPQVLPFICPSRYCESDALASVAMQHFGSLPQGYARVAAIRDWVHARLRFQSNSSTATTSARDSLAAGAGVCRDFAHVMIALCRALSIPARFATGFDYGADSALGPPDFHAYVEAYLGNRWYLFDPSGTAIPMAFVRLGTGRDAADAAFAMIFGKVQSEPPFVHIAALPIDDGSLMLPQLTTDALSTDAGMV